MIEHTWLALIGGKARPTCSKHSHYPKAKIISRGSNETRLFNSNLTAGLGEDVSVFIETDDESTLALGDVIAFGEAKEPTAAWDEA